MLKRLFLSVGLVCCLIFLGQAEKTVKECEAKIPESLKNRVCELRNYTTDTSEAMGKHMQCVLKVVGFVTESGEVKRTELLDMLKKVDNKDGHDGNVDKCVTQASNKGREQKANTFYTCLLGTSSSSAFKNAIDYNELLKAEKLELGTPFNENQVKELIKEIDDGVCQKSQ